MSLDGKKQYELWNQLKLEGIAINETPQDAEEGTYTDIFQYGKYTYKVSFKRETLLDDYWDTIISIRRFYIV